MPDRNTDRNPAPAQATGTQEPESTLLPMLIGGLVLIVIGAVIVMNFV